MGKREKKMKNKIMCSAGGEHHSEAAIAENPPSGDGWWRVGGKVRRVKSKP